MSKSEELQLETLSASLAINVLYRKGKRQGIAFHRRLCDMF